MRGRAQNHPNGPKWLENSRQAWRIGPDESYHGSGAFATGPLTENLPKKGRNLEIGGSGLPLSGSTPQVAHGADANDAVLRELGVAHARSYRQLPGVPVFFREFRLLRA